MSLTLLCADPDRDLCQLLARALGADGCRVIVAHDGDEALEAMRRRPPDLVLLDVALPGRDGLAVLEAMRKSASPAAAVPVILWSVAVCDPEQIERARKLGASALLRKPIPLDALLARVTKLLTRERDGRVVDAARTTARVRRSAPLRGSLADLPFPALLHQAHGLRANGVLYLRNGEKRKEVELCDGRPAAVRSNLPSERLGDWLLRSDRIEPDMLAESARRLLGGEGLQGQILVGMQVLSEEDLGQALREQADEKLLEIFEWPSGEFALAVGATLKRATALPLAGSAADLIRTGVRTRLPMERIDAVLRVHVNDAIVPSSNPFYSFQEVALGDDERALLTACGRGLASGSLLAKPERLRRAVYALLEIGMLEIREGEVFRSGGPAPVVRLHGESHARNDRNGEAKTPLPAVVVRTPSSRSGPAAAEDHSHYAADHEQRMALTTVLERLSKPSPFEKLGVARDATDTEIRSAYVSLAKEAHPDRYAKASHAVHDLAERAFREVTRAFELLSDPASLSKYRADPECDRKEAHALDEAQRAIAAERAFQKGEARLRSHDWSGALGHFEHAVELFPDEGEYLAYCGWCYYLTHGHDEVVFRKAFELVKRGAKLAPGREKPYLFLGRLCQAAERLELAERMFMKAVECRPDSIEALRELRLLQMRRPKRGLLGRLLRRPAPTSERKPNKRERPS